MLKLIDGEKTLRKLRVESGVSMAEIAERLNISYNRAGVIERSDNLSYDLIMRYLGALGYKGYITVKKER